jgi:hypothetical protein
MKNAPFLGPVSSIHQPGIPICILMLIRQASTTTNNKYHNRCMLKSALTGVPFGCLKLVLDVAYKTLREIAEENDEKLRKFMKAMEN